MPTSLVHTPAQEHDWNRAKEIVTEQYKIGEDSDRFYALTTGVYQRMQGLHKAQDGSPDMAELCRGLAQCVQKCGPDRRQWAMGQLSRAMTEWREKCLPVGKAFPGALVTLTWAEER